jgi:polyisoprenoid-binding protein YceI
MLTTSRAHRLPVPAILACVTVLFPASIWSQSGMPAGSTRIEMTAGSTAEYRVREQLARLNFPNDAVGVTGSLSGSIVLGPQGAVASGSKLTVDLRDLKSDAGRRDSFLRENTLHTNRFPTAAFVPTRQQGLTVPLPSSGKVSFKLIGSMTIHGVTSELTWDVTATFTPTTVTGQATTRFPFKTFGLEIPKVMGLLSVDDDIRLVLNIKASRRTDKMAPSVSRVTPVPSPQTPAMTCRMAAPPAPWRASEWPSSQAVPTRAGLPEPSRSGRRSPAPSPTLV